VIDFTKDCVKIVLEEAECLLNEPESLASAGESERLEIFNVAYQWAISSHLLSQSPVVHESHE